MKATGGGSYYECAYCEFRFVVTSSLGLDHEAVFAHVERAHSLEVYRGPTRDGQHEEKACFVKRIEYVPISVDSSQAGNRRSG
jgi:hypothetical protein